MVNHLEPDTLEREVQWALGSITRNKTSGGDGIPVQYVSSVTQSCPTLATVWTATSQASLSVINSWSLLKLRSIELVMPSNHLILCHPLLFMPSIFPSIRVFSNESLLQRSKYWSFSFSIRPSNEYLALISFRMDWSDLFRYDLNQIRHDSTVEVTNRFKGLDLIERVPEELWMDVRDIVQETGIKTIPMEKKCKKGKWLSGEPYK